MSRSQSSLHNESYPRSRIEWGLETGVEGKKKTRLVSLNEIHNFRRITHSGFNFYLTIVDTQHPKFVRNREKGAERWRMRFNVFTTGFFAQWLPNTLLHLGELHVYYDLFGDRSTPRCVDFTFYYDYRKIDTEVIKHRYEQMENAFKDALMGRDQRMRFLLFLPIIRQHFLSPNEVLDDFLERQDVMLSQLEQMKYGHDYEAMQNYSYRAPFRGDVPHNRLIDLQEPQGMQNPYHHRRDSSYQRSIDC